MTSPSAPKLEDAQQGAALRGREEAVGLPRTRSAIDALPYTLHYGHWGLTAWERRRAFSNDPYIELASVNFPVGARGPFDPPEVQDRCFALLDAQARAALKLARGE